MGDRAKGEIDSSAVLGPIPLPGVLIATRGSEAEPWGRLDQRNAAHPQWLVSATDQYGRPVEAVIDHDVVVHLGGVKLDDPRLGSDALTRRRVALAIMMGSTARRFEGRAVFSLLYSLDWLTRWRLSLGIWCNADLKGLHFADFLAQARSARGVAYLVPIQRRIADLAVAEAEQASKGWRLKGSALSRLGGDQLSALLGATSDAVLSNPSLRREIAAAFGSLADVSPDGGRAGSDSPLSVRRLQQLLLPWHVLQDMSGRGLLPQDPLRFRPFEDEDDGIARVAARNGAVGWKPAIAPPYFMLLLSAATRWVLDYAPHLLEAMRAMRDDPALREPGGTDASEKAARRVALSKAFDERLPPAMPRLMLSWRSDTSAALGGEQRRISMMQAITHLMTACLIIIAGFGARTIGEALGMRMGCIRRTVSGLHELSLRLEDGVRDLDAMPVPPIVPHAVRALEELSADTRAATGDDHLFQFVRRPWALREEDAGRRPALAFPKKGYLAAFAAINGLPSADPETFAPFTGDQLRLGFAVSYHHVIPGLPTEALTRALGQFSPSDTLEFIERSLPGAAARVSKLIRARQSAHRDAAGPAGIDDLRELLRDLRSRSEGFEAVRSADVLRLLQGMVDGADLPGGPGGERLLLGVQAIVDDVRRRVWVRGRNHPDAERGELREELSKFARSLRVDVVPGRHTRCVRLSTDEGLPHARCKHLALEALPWKGTPPTDAAPDRPDFEYAGILPCCGCHHGAAFSPELAVVDAECARVADGGGAAETGAAKEARLAQLAKLRAARKAATPSGRRIV